MKSETRKVLIICVAAALFYLFIHYWETIADFLSAMLSAATPLLIGCVLAYVVNILMAWFERHFFPKSKGKLLSSLRRPICLFLAIVLLLAIIALIVRLILPQLIDCVVLVVNLLPPAINKLLDYIAEHEMLSTELLNTLESIDWKSKIGQILNVVTTGVGSVMDVVLQVVTSVFSGLVTSLLAIIFALYLLLGKERLGSQFRRIMKHYLKPNWNRKITHVISVLDSCFHSFIVGQCTEAVILGAMCVVGMLILKLPYATMIGTLIGFTALIPVAGAYIGGGIGAFMILTVAPNQALIFLIFLVLLQQIEGNLIYPRVVGSSLKLPGIWVLVAVTVGGGVLGVAGMLLGVPVMAAIYRMIRDDVSRKEAGTCVIRED